MGEGMARGDGAPHVLTGEGYQSAVVIDTSQLVHLGVHLFAASL